MTDSELKDPENWYDFGLTDYLDTDEGLEKFPDWLAVANEGIRIMDIHPDSPGAHAIKAIAAAAARRGYDEDA